MRHSTVCNIYMAVCKLYNSLQSNSCDMCRVQSRIHAISSTGMLDVVSSSLLNCEFEWITGMKSKHHISYYVIVQMLFLSSLISFDVFITSAVAHTNANPNAQDLISRLVPSRFITASLRTRLKYSAKSTHTNRKRKTQNAKVESKDVIYDGNNSMSQHL